MVRKSDEILTALSKSGALTEDGKAWLIAAIDPFHDEDIRLAGYPDLLNSNSVVQLVKKQVQISAPAGLPTGANWDCNMTLWPTLRSGELNGYMKYSNNGALSDFTPFPGFAVGGFTCISGQSGNTLGFAGPGVVPSVNNSNLLQCLEYMKGNMRVIGMAFEVINTTADMYKQGQVLVYKMPTKATNTNVGQTVPVPNGIVNIATFAKTMRLPPATLAAAELLYGSRKWAASEGAYVIARQNDMDNPFDMPVPVPIVYTGDDLTAFGTQNYVATYSTNQIYQGSGDTGIISPFDLSGAFFTGLSASTTLTVTVRWILERVPGPAEFDLVVLASPSSRYDPVAMECYSHAVGQMPPGVMLKENPLGEWFKKALTGISAWAPKIGTALGTIIPGAATVGNIVGKVAGGGTKLVELVESKKKKKKNTDAKPKPDPRALPGSRSGLAYRN